MKTTAIKTFASKHSTMQKTKTKDWPQQMLELNGAFRA
jgi:hypothetical protein